MSDEIVDAGLRSPNPRTFFQFQPPQLSSNAECRAPGPISRVDNAARLM